MSKHVVRTTRRRAQARGQRRRRLRPRCDAPLGSAFLQDLAADLRESVRRRGPAASA